MKNTANQSQLLNLGTQFFAEPETEPSGEPEAELAAEPETESVQPEAETGEEPEAPESAESVEPQRYPIKHNRETYELTIDELIANAQKGLDYDRIRPGYEFLKKLAHDSGTDDVNQYISLVDQRITEQGHQNAVQQLVDAGYDPAMAETVVTQGEQIAKINKVFDEREKAVQRERDDAQKWAEVRKEFPDIFKSGKPEIPDGAAKILVQKFPGPDDKAGPLDLLEALRIDERNRLKAELNGYKAKEAAIGANSEGAAASMGSMSGERAQVPEITKEAIESGKIDERTLVRNWAEVKRIYNMK